MADRLDALTSNHFTAVARLVLQVHSHKPLANSWRQEEENNDRK